MLYDIINIVNGVFSLLAIIYSIAFLHHVRAKQFIPERARRSTIRSGRARLAVKCFAFGFVVNAMTHSIPIDLYVLIVSMICYALLFYVSYESYQLIQEKSVTIRDVE